MIHNLFHRNMWKHMRCRECTFSRALWGAMDLDARMRTGEGLADNGPYDK
jgi:hypothetical protein